ncbi:MAG: VOC family protein [Mycobacteriales bacterium]
MVGIGEVVIHVSDIDKAAEFWERTLESCYQLVDRDHNSAMFCPKTGEGLAIQLNTEDQTHVDLVTADAEERDREIERVLSLGAQRVDWPHRDEITVLTAPGGLTFCLL